MKECIYCKRLLQKQIYGVQIVDTKDNRICDFYVCGKCMKLLVGKKDFDLFKEFLLNSLKYLAEHEDVDI